MREENLERKNEFYVEDFFLNFETFILNYRVSISMAKHIDIVMEFCSVNTVYKSSP